MKVKLYSGPSIEPITLNELKLHLRLTSGEFADNVDSTQSIAPGSHAITTGYALVGAGVDVLGYSAIVNLVSGANQATGTVDVKIQESDNNVSFSDWSGGAFTQITTANDNATYEMPYSGVKQYIRVVAKVLLAACEFGVNILRDVSTGAEDDLLNSLITTARQQVENVTGRRLITQEWDYFLDGFPGTGQSFPPFTFVDSYTNHYKQHNFIKIPFGNLQSITSFTWTDMNNVTTTLVKDTDFVVELNGEECGRIVLPPGKSWPSGTLWTSQPIAIRFKCGYGDTAATVPAQLKTAMKMLAANMYEGRGETEYSSKSVENPLFERLTFTYKLWDEFDDVT